MDRLRFVCLFCVCQTLALNSLLAICSPVKLLEKNVRGGSSTNTSVGKEWTNCGDSSDPLNITAVTVVPMPPKRGQNVVITANVTLAENVTSGSFQFNLKYGRIPIMKNTSKLCDAVKFSDEHCPLKVGVHILGIGFVVPQKAMKGHYTGMVTAADQNDKQLFCMALDFQV